MTVWQYTTSTYVNHDENQKFVWTYDIPSKFEKRWISLFPGILLHKKIFETFTTKILIIKLTIKRKIENNIINILFPNVTL